MKQDTKGKPYPSVLFNPDADISNIITDVDRQTWAKDFLHSVRDPNYPKAFYIVWIREELKMADLENAVTSLADLSMADACNEMARILRQECAKCK
jgi:hypothetical protein